MAELTHPTTTTTGNDAIARLQQAIEVKKLKPNLLQEEARLDAEIKRIVQKCITL